MNPNLRDNEDLLEFSESLSYISIRYPEYYFTNYHFTDGEIDYFLNYTTEKGLYKDVFMKFIKEKLDSKKEVFLCTSHDIAPFIYKQFSINKNELNSKDFIKKYKKFKGLITEK